MREFWKYNFWRNIFSFFLDNSTESFSYNIIYIDFPSGLALTIFTPNGDYVSYYDYNLSNPENNYTNTSLFPNPVNDNLFISSTIENDLLITIYDISGKLILSEAKKKSGDSISIQNLKAGIYFVSISDENGNATIKRIVKN